MNFLLNFLYAFPRLFPNPARSPRHFFSLDIIRAVPVFYAPLPLSERLEQATLNRKGVPTAQSVKRI